ncbi:MAG: L,D-transpeptidase family protein [Candidatus Pacebacteria bacterium]|nr:L,D-transpeptidase family protein [Candidatus Paceibacterota bacterium]
MPGDKLKIKKETTAKLENPEGEIWTEEDEKVLNELLKEKEEILKKLEEIKIKPEQKPIENIDIESLIKENISPEEKTELDVELSGENIIEAVKEEVVKELNDKTIEPANKEGRKEKEGGALKRVARKIKNTLLGLLVISSFEGTTSFTYPDSDEVMTYNKMEVKNLDDWENIKLDQDSINKLNNISIINEANKDRVGKYLIVDKSSALAHLYENGNLLNTYEAGVGEREGDEQTVTIVRNGKIYWAEGNKKTGAGIYTVDGTIRYNKGPCLTLTNERGIQVPSALHNTTQGRKKFFKDNKKENNRMSNGCVNFMADDLRNLIKEANFGEGDKVYVLPDDPHNKFQIVDGELRFLSNTVGVNRTIKSYEAKPIVLKVEDINNTGKEFLQTIADSKEKLMALYPTVSNDVYNQLAKTAYGIFGQESTFGTYGKVRGQYGRIRDRAGEMLGRNVSAGVTQVRITSINPKVKELFNIKETKDLFNTKNSAIATMSLLMDIYTTNIPEDKKGNYEELVPIYYNSPTNFKRVKDFEEKQGSSTYVRNIKNYSKKVKVYLSNY